MKVELLKTTRTPGSPRPADATVAPEAQPSAPVPQNEQSRRKFIDSATSWAVVLPALLIAVAVLAWSLVWRLPEKNRLITVSARELPSAPALSKPVSDEDLAELRQRLQVASATFVQKREDIGPLIARLEGKARAMKLWMEFSLKPAVVQQVGQKEFLRHPVTIQLVDDNGQDGAAHKRFYAWLREAVTLDKRAEITALSLHGSGAGLAKAQVELHLFSLTSHEELAPK